MFLLFPLLVFAVKPDKKTEPEKVSKNELDRRIELVTKRILEGDIPRLTSDFILADISLKPEFQRRFTEFSGDISGRYFDLFSSFLPENNPVDIHKLMDEAVTYQKPDGRFGDEKLAFETSDLAGKQMALLWGNGRLLVGMMKYNHRYKKSEVLAAAKQLGDFLNGITMNCVNPEVVERLKDKNAMGYICFTQLMEGLVLLYDETRNQQYIETASEVYTLLPEPGKQHSHGYLNTLLGTLMLYERTQNPEQLQFVKSRYNKLVNSPEYLITGGVAEYFGCFGNNTECRDEGCSEADFVMLSLQLWQTTGETTYLERAENCLLNHLFPNQYETGDFGHHEIDPAFGIKTAKNTPRAWWCCNFHGCRAMNEAREIIFTRKADTLFFNLFLGGNYNDENLVVNASQTKCESNKFSIEVEKARDNQFLAVRVPSWAKNVFVTKNGKNVNFTLKGEYLVSDNPVKKGEVYEVSVEYKLKWVDFRRQELTLPIETKTKAALFYGPYLMSADSGFQPFFDSEPNGGNYIDLKNLGKFVPKYAPKKSKMKNTYLQLEHFHSDMYGTFPVILRPLCETTWQPPCNARIWFDVK